jgi:hypothetical protein
VTEEMVHALGVAGTADQARGRLAELRDGLVDLPIITVPRQAAGEMAMATIQALAPDH